MKVFAVLFCCVLVIQANVLISDTVKQWEQFKHEHGKEYGTETEEKFRFKIFRENVKKITEHNKDYEEGRTTYTMGVNRFADLLPSEFAEMMLTSERKSNPKHEARETLPPADVPDSFDWRPEGAVTPVKDQGNCGSCWAFSATGSIEGAHFLDTGNLVSLSEQNIMDCSDSYGNYGCSGGFEYYGMQYVADNGGVDTEESYPYEAQDGRCRYDPNNSGASISGYKKTKPKDEEDLKKAVATIGPISVAVDASNFQSYRGGIYVDRQCSTDFLNHAILAVGYGSEDGQDFWIVKNSWGESWGEEGYIRMARNHHNTCGIASDASYPYI